MIYLLFSIIMQD